MIKSMSAIIITGTFLLLCVTGSAAECGITRVLSWSPGEAVQFKTASVCYFPDYEDFGIFAVFTIRSASGGLSDRLWYLRVQGSSGSFNYGMIIDSALISKESVISHVDCTSDGARAAYVVWDRSDDPLDTLNARWTRVEITGSADPPNEVPRCESGASWANGIAYHDGALAISGAGRAACSGCTYVWPDAGDPADYVRNLVWFDGQTAKATDVIWNGVDRFLAALLIKMDGTGEPALATVQVSPDGSLTGWELYQDESWTDSSYSAVQMVDSKPADSTNPVFIQTDRRSFWCGAGGEFNGVHSLTPMSAFAACEYCGKADRTAHTYRAGMPSTVHMEWPATAGDPVNVYGLSEANVISPVACRSTAHSLDAKILLVRKSFPPNVRYMYYNFEPQN